MYRTAEFRSTFPNEQEFDEADNPITPWAHDLAETVIAQLRRRVQDVSSVAQHEFYGWGFDAKHEGANFYNVINQVEECYLTISMDWYLTKALLLKRPKDTFDRYCEVVSEVLDEMAEVSELKWEAYRR